MATKLIVPTTTGSKSEDEPKSEIKSKVRLKMKKEIPTQYNKYSGIIDDNGKKIDKPTEGQAIKNMVNYMKNNKSDQSDNPSNVYRPEYQPDRKSVV